MPREEKFYRLNDYQDKVTPGAELVIKHSVSFNEWYADPHITPLVGLSEQTHAIIRHHQRRRGLRLN